MFPVHWQMEQISMKLFAYGPCTPGKVFALFWLENLIFQVVRGRLFFFAIGKRTAL